MKYILIILLLLISTITYAAQSIHPGTKKFCEKNWSKIIGWCFTSKWHKLKLPEAFKPHFCLPKRWGSVDVLAFQKISLDKETYFMIGHKVTYSKFRYEFYKAKELWGHGPYLYFKVKF